eukprot:CAMPEP_0172312208 /NCGR_PEP_ID=MMETSP1058-20130122/17030_1 /TAXON_ID=83371 /ORGANISM="Detonula confervacea, Strain CCMP 353" /LENGTH=290 /DNA_ID=CAMNT_0013025603 /DNA_START=62 /DNA_END=934 /DNA_ORIENTATION=-
MTATLIFASSCLALTGQIFTSAFSSGSVIRKHDNIHVVRERRCSLFVPALSPPPLPLVTDPISSSTSLSAIREATFGMGCFWEPAESLLKKPGILATTVGYTGAPPKKKAPTYDAVCFGNYWVEGVRVAYDDELVSYDQVLDYFFQLQKPGYSRQYASVVFANDATEVKQATQWKKERIAKQSDNKISPYEIVEIEPVSPFYKAEEYHQRYWEKQRLRYLIAIALIAGESGAYNDFFDGALGRSEVFGLPFDSICGGVFFVGAAWMLLERLLAGEVKELEQGDLTAAAGD